MTTFCQHCNGEFEDNNFAIADGGYIHAKCGQVTHTMNTHNERRQWLYQHGWKADDIPRSHDIKGIGQSVHFEETAHPCRGLWMAISTGVALLDGPRDEAMTWRQLVEWIEGKSPEVKKPLAGQRSLFGDE